jgi:hypothetical protein
MRHIGPSNNGQQAPAVVSVTAACEQQKETKSAMPRLAYSMEETAGMLGLSYITVWRLLKRGLIKSVPGLRHKVIPATEIQRFLNVA